MEDEGGYILIDRDGRHFIKILNYLRSGILPAIKDDTEANELLVEADFYCIDELKIHCKNYKFSKGIMVYSLFSTKCNEIFREENPQAKAELPYKSLALQKLFLNKELGNPTCVPISSDGRLSFPYLQIAFKNRLSSSHPDGRRICFCDTDQIESRINSRYAQDCPHYSDSFNKTCEKILKNIRVFVVYWKHDDGLPKEKELMIQENKVLPPDDGWFECPIWAFEGPHYYMSRN